MTSYFNIIFTYTHENRPKIESFPLPGQNLEPKKVEKYSKWQKKNTILSKNFAISGSFDVKP